MITSIVLGDKHLSVMQLDMKNIVIIAAVIYNRSILDSPLLALPQSNNRLDVLICDNSNAAFQEKNESLANKLKISYLNMHGNKGLSRAYNKITEYTAGKTAYVCLLDDDTKLPENYADLLLQEIENYPVDILAPLVFDKKGLLSPFSLGERLTKRIDLSYLNEYKNDINKLAAINSGLVIKTSLFEKLQFDEQLFLDCVDMAFFREARKLNPLPQIHISQNIVLHQNFAASEASLENLKTRYAIQKKDIKIFCGNTVTGRLVSSYLLARRWLGINLRRTN